MLNRVARGQGQRRRRSASLIEALRHGREQAQRRYDYYSSLPFMIPAEQGNLDKLAAAHEAHEDRRRGSRRRRASPARSATHRRDRRPKLGDDRGLRQPRRGRGALVHRGASTKRRARRRPTRPRATPRWARSSVASRSGSCRPTSPLASCDSSISRIAAAICDWRWPTAIWRRTTSRATTPVPPTIFYAVSSATNIRLDDWPNRGPCSFRRTPMAATGSTPPSGRASVSGAQQAKQSFVHQPIGIGSRRNLSAGSASVKTCGAGWAGGPISGMCTTAGAFGWPAPISDG